MERDTDKNDARGFSINDGEFLDSLKEAFGDDYGKIRKMFLQNFPDSPISRMMKYEDHGRY